MFHVKHEAWVRDLGTLGIALDEAVARHEDTKCALVQDMVLAEIAKASPPRKR
jgi:hypothetical protein